jgi:parvulin-like peptidyl-prolyl isomerase
MAKQPQKEQPRELTRKQERHRSRAAEQNRRILIGVGVAVGLIVLILAAGVFQQLVLNPRQPVATVNGTSITTQDYAKRVRFDWFQQGQQTQQDPLTTSQQTLDGMVDDQLIQAEALKRGITVSQDEVDKAIEQYFGYQRTPPTPTATPLVSPTPSPTPSGTPAPTSVPAPTPTPMSPEAYQSAKTNFLGQLQQRAGMNETDFRGWIQSRLLAQKVYEAITKDVPTKEEQLHARHILINVVPEQPTPTPLPAGQPSPTPTVQPTPGGPTPAPTPAPRTDAQALALANDIEAKLKAGGDFAALAQQYSSDTGSARNGGDLGWFGKGMMVPEFETAAFGLQAGQISDPVKTNYGYHIIQVVEKDPARQLDDFTLQQRKSEAFQKWLDAQKTAAKIVKSWSADKVPPTPLASQSQ